MQGTLEPHLIENGLVFAEWCWLGAILTCLVLALYVVMQFIRIVRKV